jgi:NAD(P)H dehydrogenase (quinone)
MNILIVLGHPSPASFNHALAESAAQTLRAAGHRITLHDLCTENFDPRLPAAEAPASAPLPPVIAAHCRDLQEADGIVIIHPNWWGQPPAILKGWIDRVVRPGIAYRFQERDSGDGIPVGLLQARSAIVFNTSNTPAARETAVFGDPLQNIWKECVFGLCGVRDFHRRMFAPLVTSSPAQRNAWLAEVARPLPTGLPSRHCPPELNLRFPISRLPLPVCRWTVATALLTGFGTLPAPAQLRISEFMAANASVIQDEDGDYSDWVEIHNAGPTAVDLGGWHLTDTPANRTRWTFPPTHLPADGFLLVFASGKNRTATAPHANFSLDCRRRVSRPHPARWQHHRA